MSLIPLFSAGIEDGVTYIPVPDIKHFF